MLTDTHCHLDLDTFDTDRDEVIERAFDAGVRKMLVPGLELDSSRAAVHLANAHSHLYAAVGFHPTEIGKMTAESFDELARLAGHAKVAAIGEIGLDYYWVKEPQNRLEQRQKLPLQLELAATVNKPVILHLREEGDALFGSAADDLFAILDVWLGKLLDQNHPLYSKPGVFHSFNGNLASAERAIAMNFQIGITGSVTYKNNNPLRELVREIPLDRLVIETDSPFQTPVPHRGKRNEPVFLGHIADKIAALQNTSREQIATITSDNAARLFGWEADL